jgi:hypothetical protein
MAPPLSKYKFEPMDLTNMRQNGVRSIEVTCHGCRHGVILNVDQYPGGLLVLLIVPDDPEADVR